MSANKKTSISLVLGSGGARGLAHIGVIFPVHMFYAENPDLRILIIIGLVLFIIYFLSIVTDKESRSLYDKLLGVNVISLK